MDCARCGIIFAKMHRPPSSCGAASAGSGIGGARLVEEWLLVAEESVNPSTSQAGRWYSCYWPGGLLVNHHAARHHHTPANPSST